jgi:hypothetical protein
VLDVWYWHQVTNYLKICICVIFAFLTEKFIIHSKNASYSLWNCYLVICATKLFCWEMPIEHWDRLNIKSIIRAEMIEPMFEVTWLKFLLNQTISWNLLFQKLWYNIFHLLLFFGIFFEFFWNYLKLFKIYFIFKQLELINQIS